MPVPYSRLPHSINADDTLSSSAKCVMSALDRHLDKKTGICAPSTKRLALSAGLSRRIVMLRLAELEAAGRIQIHRSFGRQNHYTLGTQTCHHVVTGHPPANLSPRGDRVTGHHVVTGLGDSDLIGVKEQEEKEAVPPPEVEQLFDPQHRHWLQTAVEYHLDGYPDLAPLRPWFPRLLTDFFVPQRWLDKESDPRYAIEWACGFQELQATEAEVRAALAWARTEIRAGTFVDGQGHKVYNRPDTFAKILSRIRSQRKRPAIAPATPPEAPRMSEAELEAFRASTAELQAKLAAENAAIVGGQPPVRRLGRRP
jgi:hypothetical protein